jgi:SpoVK/Ycf46/Vps4 family AAA+-type ATPase
MNSKTTVMPEWAATLAEKYRGGTLWEFIIHGNINDLVPYNLNGKTTFVPLKDYLRESLFARRNTVIHYDLASGIQIHSPEQMRLFLNVVKAVDTASGSQFSSQGLPRDPARALFLIERFLLSQTSNNGKDRTRAAIVIDFTQLIAPAGSVNNLSIEESTTIITLLKWAKELYFKNSDITVCLLCENLAELNDMLVKSSDIAKLRIPLPDHDERLDYIRHDLAIGDFDKLSEIDPVKLATLTAGLSRVNLMHLVNQAIKNEKKLTLDYVKTAKKDLIEQECFGLLEFIQTKNSLDTVVGHDAAKTWLSHDALLIKDGKTDALPMGYLLCGPVGTGKTFLATCFTGTIGIPCIKLLNFRSQWQGVTEGNWEKILTVLKAMGPVGVIIDEADAAVGNRGASGDSGTSSRVFAQLAQTMGNTEYRGKILWFLLTCRPDLLPVDLKRQGRAEVHIPLFYPSTPNERKNMYMILAKKTKTPIEKDAVTNKVLKKDLSGSDIEAVLVRSKRRAYLMKQDIVTADILESTVDTFIPSVRGEEIELQELAAVIECSNKSFLNKAYREKKRGPLQKRLSLLKRSIE